MKTQIQTQTVKIRLLKETPDGSICPECNRILPAAIFERGGRVWITKTCPEHCEYQELYYGSFEMYNTFSRFQHEEGVDHMQLNSNAINLVLDTGLAERVRKAGVNTVYMRFDLGLDMYLVSLSTAIPKPAVCGAPDFSISMYRS